MSWQVSWRTFFFFQGKCSGRGISPAVWQRKCARKLEQSSCLVSLVSFSLNNLSGRSWGLCLPSAPSDWILATACQEQNWGAVCLCQQHSLPPEAAWGTVQPWRMETGRYSLTGWVCIGEVASWLQAGLPSAPPAKGAGTEDGWWAGPLSFSPAGALVACLALHVEPLQGTELMAMESQLLEASWVQRSLGKPFWWVIRTLLLCMVGMKAAYNPDLPFPLHEYSFQ